MNSRRSSSPGWRMLSVIRIRGGGAFAAVFAGGASKEGRKNDMVAEEEQSERERRARFVDEADEDAAMRSSWPSPSKRVCLYEVQSNKLAS